MTEAQGGEQYERAAKTVAYWEGERELFEGVAIAELAQRKAEAWQPHPVFYFDSKSRCLQEWKVQPDDEI